MSSNFNVPMLNKVMIVANVANDPKISLTNGNKIKVANFRIVCVRKFRLKSGNLKEETSYVNVTAWMKLAEICENNLQRGDKVYIEGSIQSKQISNSQYSVVGILAERIQILSQKKIIVDRDQDIEVEDVSSDNDGEEFDENGS